MTIKLAPLTLQKTRIIKAPVERVYKAWTEPEQIKQWFGCGPTSCVELTQDLKIGGSYHAICDGGKATMSGVFKEITPNRKLVYSWSNTSDEFPAQNTLVTVEFKEIDKNTTELTLTHENFQNENTVEGHTIGWGAALDKFVALFDAA